jgi:ABC transporter with metal-binding/Fe-S-binding domain ATP-binding protein
MKLAVLFSGGKDSCLALHKAKQEGNEIRYLLTILPENFDSFMFHKPHPVLLKKQAERLGIELAVGKSKGEKEKELEDLKELIMRIKDDVDGIVVGGIASSYQGKRIKKICEELDLKFVAPLWEYDSEEIWKELLDEGFKVILTKISCEGIPKEFLGKIIDETKLEELKKLGKKYKFRIDFEGGEAESAVLGMPEFKKDIKIRFDIKDEGEYRHYIQLEEVR